MLEATGLNRSADRVFQNMLQRSDALGIRAVAADCGASVLDCGVETSGGLEAGVEFARLCLADRARVSVVAGDRSIWKGPWVQVQTDDPVRACILGQYAGWPVQHDGFFAMGSGPMRVRRGKEPVLEELSTRDADSIAVGTLECDQLPSDAAMESMAAECGVDASDLRVAVAPTRSVAGCVQVVARSVETSLHKLHDLGFPIEQVQAGFGYAPLCPPTPSFAKGIGRTNDAILYGGHVTLWIDGDDEQIAEAGQRLPSIASKDYGEPFAEIFKRCDNDFYKIDPGLFSPAEIELLNVSTGRSFCFGGMRADLVESSFRS
ncbi:MAG: methenyltetrahydromethanopterin cyclohydrolase [Pirellulaceae bacterium]